LLKNKFVAFCKDNNYKYNENIYTFESSAISQFDVVTKTFFKRIHHFLFIKSDNFNYIELLAKTLSEDKKFIKDVVILLCETTLNLNHEHCLYIGENGSQFVHCVYHNIDSNKYTYYTETIGTPKLLKDFIKNI